MNRTANDYLQLLHNLLPPGRLWVSLRREGSTFNQLLLAFADELARVDGREHQLRNEAHPQFMSEMMADWETLLGLPECGLSGFTTQQRRNQIQSKLNLVGDNRAQYFIDIAARLGYSVTITETPPNAYAVNSVTSTTIIEITCESPCTDPLRIWGNTDLECALRRINPAHLQQTFVYPP